MNDLPQPTFTVVITDYDQSIPRELFRRKMQCLADQTCKDFEVLVYHDGPKQTTYEQDVEGLQLHDNTRFIVTEKRMNDWGHSNRDRGIREACGEWIIHTNSDNVFYSNMIERLKEEAKKERPPFTKTIKRRYPIIVKSIIRRLDIYFGTNLEFRREVAITDFEIMVYAIRMQGLVPHKWAYQRRKELSASHSIVFGGIPIKFGQIDAMQFVMRRDIWLNEGGWYDKSEESDGKMYPRFARKYNAVAVSEILGEHW